MAKRTNVNKDLLSVLFAGQFPESSPLYTPGTDTTNAFTEAGELGKNIFDLESAKKKSGLPELEPMAELPMPEGEQARQARRRSLLKQRKRRGRESTILTSPMSLLSEEIGV